MSVKYSLLGGVNQTTNLLASKLFGLDLLTKTPLIDSDIDCDDLLLTEEDFILNDVDLLKLIQKRITDEEYNKLKTRIFRVLYPAVSSFQSNKFSFDITNKDNLKEDLLLFTLCTNALYTENSNNFKFMLFLNYSEAIDNVGCQKNVRRNILQFGCSDTTKIEFYFKLYLDMSKEEMYSFAKKFPLILISTVNTNIINCLARQCFKCLQGSRPNEI